MSWFSHYILPAIKVGVYVGIGVAVVAGACVLFPEVALSALTYVGVETVVATVVSTAKIVAAGGVLFAGACKAQVMICETVKADGREERNEELEKNKKKSNDEKLKEAMQGASDANQKHAENTDELSLALNETQKLKVELEARSKELKETNEKIVALEKTVKNQGMQLAERDKQNNDRFKELEDKMSAHSSSSFFPKQRVSGGATVRHRKPATNDTASSFLNSK